MQPFFYNMQPPSRQHYRFVVINPDGDQYTNEDLATRNASTLIRRFQGGLAATTALMRLARTRELYVLKTSFPATFSSDAEARLLVQSLRAPPHANIVNVLHAEYDCLLASTKMYMEFCDGGDLFDQMKHFKYQLRCVAPVPFVLRVLTSMTDALAFLHHGLRREEGGGGGVQRLRFERNWEPILHADIKPENIMLRWGPGARVDGMPEVVLADFGHASVASESRNVLGTPMYRAPEIQAVWNLLPRHREAFNRAVASGPIMTTESDIYSMGMVMYELATGLPWMVGQDPGRVRRLDGDYNRLGVKRAVLRCLIADPARRVAAWERRGDDLVDATSGMAREIQRQVRIYGPARRAFWKQPFGSVV